MEAQRVPLSQQIPISFHHNIHSSLSPINCCRFEAFLPSPVILMY